MDELTERLRQRADSAIAVTRYQLRAVKLDVPALMVVLEGTKRLRLGRERISCDAGRFLVVNGAVSLDIENVPDARGAYRSWGVYFPWRVIEAARALIGQHHVLAPAKRLLSSGAVDALAQPIDALLSLELGPQGQLDPVERDHRLLGLLVVLARLGHTQLFSAEPGVAVQVRNLVSSAPARDWQSAHVEAALHVSGATLRRRLADEQTSLRELVREARLHHGLVLLQTTRQPLKSIAFACGYRSTRSFAEGFVERFGVAPAVLARR